MQLLAFFFILLAAGSSQRIETQYPDRSKVTRLETAMNHLTVIELSEPVTLAAAGSPLFKIERRENKVFIQPLEEGAVTNLFVWTEAGRWTYELVPAASIGSTHFAIDEMPAPPIASQNLEGLDDAALAAPTPSLAEEMLLLAQPIRNLGVSSAANRLNAFVTEVFRKDDQLFVRYAIDNRTALPYRADIPKTFMLRSVQVRNSLHTYRYSQLGSDMAKNVRSREEVPVEILDCELPSETLLPGAIATGILTLRLPAPNSSEPMVLKIAFPSSKGKLLSVVVVL